MRIKQYDTKNNDKPDNMGLTDLNKNGVKTISIWKILSIFLILNLAIINLVNYWQPNNTKLKNTYNRQQTAMLSAYKLQYYINEFKINPDANAFHIIQQAVSLNSDIDKIREVDSGFNAENSKNLNITIEKIVASIPSIKLYQSDVDKIYRNVKSLKYSLVSDLRGRQSTLNKNLFLTTDKIENLVQRLKFDHWTSADLMTSYQKNVEDIGLEIEQYSEQVEADSLSSPYESIVDNMSELFNDLNALMPEVINLSEISAQLATAQQYQDKIITEISNRKINYVENIDDKTIIILTILLSNFILLLIVVFAKASEQTKKVYNNIKNKKEIYYLSHAKEEQAAEQQVEQQLGIEDENNDIAALNHKVIEASNKDAVISSNSSLADVMLHIKALHQKIINDSYLLQAAINNLDTLEKSENQANFLKEHVTILSSGIQKILDNATLLDNCISEMKCSNENHADKKLQEAV